MDVSELLQVTLYLVALVILSPLLGQFIAFVFSENPTPRLRLFAPLESLIYRLAGVNPSLEMTWKQYASALFVFNAIGCLFTLLLLLTQGWLPLNPEHLPNLPFDIALNTAVSYMTNTDWQAYNGETALSYLSQMVGLTVHHFTSAASGLGVLLALIRGLVRKEAQTLGNFWADLTRSILYILMPIAFGFALLLVSQGVIQNFRPYTVATSIGSAHTQADPSQPSPPQYQVLPQGPAAAQVAIKQLGTNGGGYFGANSAHPFENPTPLSNFLQLLAIPLLPSATVFAFGRLVKDKQQGLSIWCAMFGLFLAGFLVAAYSELSGNPITGLSASLEGKEQRFGVLNSVLWSSATTAASNGSVNAALDSISPLSGLIALLNMMLGEVVFGGIGAGLYGMLMFVILTVFLAGLMVGRTPEYLGKKIDVAEIRWIVIALLAPGVISLIGTSIGIASTVTHKAILNQGPHGLSEVLYAFTSTAANNGSAFAGLQGASGFLPSLFSATMLLGRFAVIVPVLAIAGSLASKKATPPSPGTFPTNGPIFTILLITVILVVGALTFFPVLCLGPIVEHFLMLAGRSF